MRTLVNIVKVTFFSSLIVATITLTGCGNDQTKNLANAVDSIAAANQQSLTEAENMIKTFPTSFEVVDLLNKSGASYIFDITNPISNAGKYETIKKQALNWGIYGIDLCYSATFNQKKETTNFLAVNQDLVKKLDISNAFDASINDRINKNFATKDSLMNIFTTQFSGIYSSLIKTSRSNIAALSISGAVIEGVYLSSQLTTFAKDKTELKKIIAGQKDKFLKLVALLSLYKDDADVQEVLGKVKEINTQYSTITETMSDDQLNAFIKTVEGVRNEFIK